MLTGKDSARQDGRGTPTELEQLFPGDSTMARRMRAFDWSQTEFGTPRGWPENLQIPLQLCLTSAFPISLWWGPRHLLFYNDACLAAMSEDKRRRALMQPGREAWSEVWDVIGPVLDRVVSTGAASALENAELYFDRELASDEVYVSWSFGPILAADGRSVDGVFCLSAENTQTVIGARRSETLRQLAARSIERQSVEAACEHAAAAMRQNPRDIPFAAIYVADPDDEAVRLSATVLPSGTHLLPHAVSALGDAAQASWPLSQVLRTKRAVDCADLQANGIRIACSEWPELAREAIVLPVLDARDAVAGLLVLGVSPRRPLDAEYRAFFNWVAAHVATMIADARAHEAERQRAAALSRIERALVDARTELARMTRVTTMGEIAASIAHEVNQPLAAIRVNAAMCARWLAADPANLPEATRSLDRVAQQADRASAVLSSIRAFLKRQPARAEAVDLNQVSDDVLGMVQGELHAHRVAVHVKRAPGAPIVRADRVQLQQVVLNLVMNAIEAMSATAEDRRRLMIEVRWLSDSELGFSVRDCGVGLSNERRDRVFDAFYSTKPEGMGMGLAISRSIIEAHGGRLSLAPKDGPGETFQFTLPAFAD